MTHAAEDTPQNPARLALEQADRLGIVLQALLVAGDPHPAAVMVAGARLFMAGAHFAGLEKTPETFREFVEGFPGIFPQAEPAETKPTIILPD